MLEKFFSTEIFYGILFSKFCSKVLQFASFLCQVAVDNKIYDVVYGLPGVIYKCFFLDL